MSVAKFSCVNFPLVFFCYSISFFFSWRGNCFHSFHDFPNFFSFLLSHLPTIFIFRFSLIFPLLFVFEVRKLLRENQIIVMNSLSNRQLLSPLCVSPLKTDPPWMKTSFTSGLLHNYTCVEVFQSACEMKWFSHAPVIVCRCPIGPLGINENMRI